MKYNDQTNFTHFFEYMERAEFDIILYNYDREYVSRRLSMVTALRDMMKSHVSRDNPQLADFSRGVDDLLRKYGPIGDFLSLEGVIELLN